MKKLLLLSLSVTLMCPAAIADTVYLYKQTDTNTVKIEEEQQQQQTPSVKTDKTGKNVYKVKPGKTNKNNKANSDINNGNTTATNGNTNSSTNANANVNKNGNGTGNGTTTGAILSKPSSSGNGKNNGNNEDVTYSVNQGDNSQTVDNQSNKKAKDNNKIKNTSGKKQDYIMAPSTKDNMEQLNQMGRMIAKINDPYVIKIDGTKYYLVKNAADGNYTLNNIVGYGDQKHSLFAALKSLNTNFDRKLTKDELTKSGIRFVALDNNGKLQLKNPSKDFVDIVYIDLSNTRESINKGDIGSFGYYDVYINKNGVTKKIIGYVSFDSDDELLEMIK